MRNCRYTLSVCRMCKLEITLKFEANWQICCCSIIPRVRLLAQTETPENRAIEIIRNKLSRYIFGVDAFWKLYLSNNYSWITSSNYSVGSFNLLIMNYTCLPTLHFIFHAQQMAYLGRSVSG